MVNEPITTLPTVRPSYLTFMVNEPITTLPTVRPSYLTFMVTEPGPNFSGETWRSPGSLLWTLHDRTLSMPSLSWATIFECLTVCPPTDPFITSKLNSRNISIIVGATSNLSSPLQPHPPAATPSAPRRRASSTLTDPPSKTREGRYTRVDLLDPGAMGAGNRRIDNGDPGIRHQPYLSPDCDHWPHGGGGTDWPTPDNTPHPYFRIPELYPSIQYD